MQGIRLEPADIPHIRLFLPLVLKEPYLAESPELLIDRILNQSTYIIKHNGKPAGIINIGLRPCPVDRSREFYLRLIYIKSDSRGNGVAAGVLDRLAEKYGKMWSIVDSRNSPAINLFKKKNWRLLADKNGKLIFVYP